MGCAAPGKSLLLIKDQFPFGPTPFDKLLWKWLKGPMTQQADFGDPTTTTGYSLCLYTGASPVLTMTMTAPAVGFCGGPCWGPISDKGYKYFDFFAEDDGVFNVLLKGGTAGKAKILVKGKDGQIPLPILGLDSSGDAIVQLQNSGGGCWSAT